MYINKKVASKDLLSTLHDCFVDGGWTVEEYLPVSHSNHREILAVSTTPSAPEGSAEEPEKRVLVLERTRITDGDGNRVFDPRDVTVYLTSSWNSVTSSPSSGALTSPQGKVHFFPFKEWVHSSTDQNRPTPGPDGSSGTWARVNYTQRDAIISGLSENSLIYVYMNINPNRAILTFEGDPTLGLTYKGRVNWLYAGAIVPFSNDDVKGNFALTFGGNFENLVSDGYREEGKTRVFHEVYRESSPPNPIDQGENTSNMRDNILMWQTSSGHPFQAHYPSVVTHNENVPISRFNASNWTNKYYMSPIYVTHGEDGFRGYLDGVMAVHNHSIIHRDELKATQKKIVDEDGTPVEKTIEKKYKYFNITVDASALTSLANTNMGLALLEYETTVDNEG